MASDFRLQIVHHETGIVVEWAPGLRAETELVDRLCERVKAKGVGVGRTSAHVVDDVRAATTELLYDLKARV